MRKGALPRILRLLAAAAAWVLFVVWWLRVANPSYTPRSMVRFTGLTVALAIGALLLITPLWIVHNRRLAKRGRRGQTSRYKVRGYTLDFLGRNLVLEQGVRDFAPVVRISIEGSNKVFRVATDKDAPLKAKPAKSIGAWAG